MAFAALEFRRPLSELSGDALVARFLQEFPGSVELPAAIDGQEAVGTDVPVRPRPRSGSAAGAAADHAVAGLLHRRLSGGVRISPARGVGGSLDLLKPNGTERPCGGGWLRSESTGRVVPRRCGSWRCPTCAKRLQGCAAATIREAFDHSSNEGKHWGFFTLTDTADAQLDSLAALSKQWKRTNLAMRRDLGMSSYALVVEPQRRGALHAHVLASIPGELFPLLREPKHKTGGKIRRSRDQYAWHFDSLVPFAQRLGWGKIADAEQVHSQAGAAGYVVKSLAGYIAKGDGGGLESFVNERLRPFRTSADWPVSFSEVCARRPADCDPGPWQKVEVKQ